MALPPSGGGLDPNKMKELQLSLETALNKQIPKAIPSLKQLGGRLGRYNAQIREQMETVIKLNEQLGRSDIARSMSLIMEETMSYIDRDAFRVRKAISAVMNEKTKYMDILEKADAEEVLYKEAIAKAKTDAERETAKESLRLFKENTKRELEQLGKQAEIYEKAKLIVKDFETARTDTQREIEQERLEGFLRGQRMLIEMSKREEEKLQRLRLQAQEKGDALLLQKAEENIKKLRETRSQTEVGIQQTLELQRKTLSQYKGGIGGVFKDALSKSFRGGIFGALFKGEGFADFPKIIAKSLFDRYALGALPESMRAKTTAALYGVESEDAIKASSAGLETQKVIAEGSESMKAMSAEALTPGSIYVHDIHAEKILMDIFDVLSGRQPEKAAKVMGEKTKGAPSVKAGKLTGIGRFLQSIAEGVKTFGDKNVFKGALGVAAVGASLLPLVGSLTLLAQLNPANLLAATLAVVAIGTGIALLGNFATQIIQGAIAMGILGVALIPFALALNIMSGIDVGGVFGALGAIIAFAGVAAVLGLLLSGPQAAVFLAGAAGLALLGVAIIPLAASLLLLSQVDGKALAAIGAGLMELILPLAAIAVMAPLLPIAGIGLGIIGSSLIPIALGLNMMPTETMELFGNLLQTIADSAGFLILAAVGITAVAGAMVAFGLASVVATTALASAKISSGFLSMIGMGDSNILDQIFMLAEKAGPLAVVASSLERIASAMSGLASAFNEFGAAEAGLETLDRIANLDATQIQNMKDVSMAIDSVLRANKELTVQNEAAQIGSAAGAAGGGGVNSFGVNSVNTFGTNNINFGQAKSRSGDPSILFSGERYYSMVYR